MRADERKNLPNDDRDDAEEVERLEDLDAGDEEAANVKGGGPRNEEGSTGSGPENLR